MKHKIHSTGFLHWVFPAMLALAALEIVITNRDLTRHFMDLESLAEPVRHPVAVWVQRCVSLLLLAASVEQIVNHMALGQRPPSLPLLGAFIGFWMGTVGLPMVLGANQWISHEFVYSLAIGIAVCLSDPHEKDRILRASRDILFLLMLAGVALIPVKTTMVLDMGYTTGIIPGVPRFGGLTPHPVTQGMLAQVALLLLWAFPYRRVGVNRLAWLLGLFVLFLAQSKTTWVAFMACASCMWLVRSGGGFWRHMSDPRRNGFGILMCLSLMAAVLAVTVWLLLGDPGGQAEEFARSAMGSQLMSMTGRDRIWEAALEEWRNNPVFGYGLTLWDAAYRAAIGMPNATHGHNQFLDDLARSGSVGATSMVVYACVLLAMSLRYARATGGLSLALFVGLLLRSISEVPLSLMGYSTELFTQLLLLTTLAAAASARPQPTRVAQPMRYGVAS